ncbi:MAG: methyltransferase domain-containing protein [Lachnospiraceae bacterium]|nr:methyltransferase domain-containing protein [Lachnospiraceae bacterium]
MGQLVDIPFEEESVDIKERVQKYWANRSKGFSDMRRDEIESNKAARWTDEFKKATNGKRNLRILDVGCGAGFFEVLLGREGHDVLGIDLTPEMVAKTNEMTLEYGVRNAGAMVMDGENPLFEEESMDVIITRNLTWTLPHPVEAYKNWYQLLKKGGILLNFDAEYAKGAHNLKLPENIAHKDISDELKDECHEIYHMLTISNLNRPNWDIEVLEHIGYKNVTADMDFASRIYIEQDEFYIPDRMFMIRAEK